MVATEAQMQAMQEAQDIDTGVDTRTKEEMLANQMSSLKSAGKFIGETVVESTPGVGEAIALKRTSDALDEGDYVGAGIEAAAGLVGLVPGVGDIVGKGIRRLKAGKIKPKSTAVSGEYYDAPSYGKFHQKAAQADREAGLKELKALRATENPTTGIFQETIQKANIGNTRGQTAEVNNVSFSPQELQNIKGLMGEDAFRETGGKLQLLEKRIAEEGYKPSNITIVVREDGTPFVQEGNHRLAEALKSGREEIKADIVYLRDAEKADGPFNPKRLNDPETDVDLLVRTSYEMENAPVAKAAARTTKAPLRVLFDKLPETERAALPPQPDENRLFGYHGTAKAREADEPFFDINFARKNDQFLGEGFYFTLDPEVASEYASIRGIKSERQIKGEQAKKILADENVIPSERGKKGSGTSVEVTPQGEYVTGGSMMKGQDIYGNPVSVGQYVGRFDLSNLEKPYVVRTEKQRKELKKMIPQLKEEGYDSILFADFKDRSKQIMVFPEHMEKINSDAINYAQGGAVPMKEQMDMFADGGLEQDGGTKDPVSGNDVPPGSTQEEVRDDIPAQLSEGEFVFPADVVRYIGLGNLMRMRQEAKMGLKLMDQMGQMGNSEEATMPDDLPFDINDLDMDDEEEYNSSSDDLEMQVGGMVPARQQTTANTGVYYQPPQFQPGQTQVGQAATPIPMAPVFRPQQQEVPVYQPPQTLPTASEFVAAPEGQTPQTITIVNKETGEERTITFIPGATQIPQGFVRKEDYVPKEVVPETQTTTVETAQVRDSDDDDDEDKTRGAVFALGTFSEEGRMGGKRGEDYFDFNVSFDTRGGMPGLMGAGSTLAGLVAGKGLPEGAVATLEYDGVEMKVNAKDYNEAREDRTGDKAQELIERFKEKRDQEIAAAKALAAEYGIKYTGQTLAEMAKATNAIDKQKKKEEAARKEEEARKALETVGRSDPDITETQAYQDRIAEMQRQYEREQRESDDDDSFTSSQQQTSTQQIDAERSGDPYSGSAGGGGRAKGGLIDKPKPKAKKMKRGGLASKK